MPNGIARPRPTWRTLSALSAIVLTGAVFRFYGLAFGLPFTAARPDENFIILVTRSFLAGDLSPRFFDYPWLYMGLLTLIYLVYFVVGAAFGWFRSVADLLASWPVHWAPFFVLDRGLSAAFGTCTVPIVFWIGRRLWNDAVGLIAAAMLAFAFIHVRDSHFGTTDIAMTFFVTLTMAFVVEAALSGRGLVAASITAGLATGTKYSALFLVAPIAVVYLQSGSPLFSKRSIQLVAAFAGALLVCMPFVVLDSSRFIAAIVQLGHSMSVGHSMTTVEPGWSHHIRFSLRYGLGIPIVVTALVGMVGIMVRTPGPGAVLLVFPAVYYAVAAVIQNRFFRYALPLVPFFCLASAWLVWQLSIAGASLIVRQQSRFSAATSLAALLTAAVVAPSARSVFEFNRIISQTDNRVVVARWFSEHVPPGSSVLQSGSLYGHAEFDPTMHYREWLWSRQELIFKLERHPASGRPDWILLQESPLPSDTQRVVKDLLQHDYVRVQDFVALTLDGRRRVYDQQDAFFVPFAGFDDVRRPGPNFYLYKRTGAVSP